MTHAELTEALHAELRRRGETPDPEEVQRLATQVRPLLPQGADLKVWAETLIESHLLAQRKRG
jgi:hypothetical protein